MKQKAGSIELLLVLPLLLVLASGIGYIQRHLNILGKLTQAAWVTGVSKNDHLPTSPNPFNSSNSSLCKETLASAGANFASFPHCFTVYLLSHCPQTTTIESTETKLHRTVIRPGKDIFRDELLKEEMGMEAMLKVKGESVPISFLGAKEFAEAFSGG